MDDKWKSSGQMNGEMDGWVGGWMGKRMDKAIDRWMDDEWMEKGMDRETDRWVKTGYWNFLFQTIRACSHEEGKKSLCTNYKMSLSYINHTQSPWVNHENTLHNIENTGSRIQTPDEL